MQNLTFLSKSGGGGESGNYWTIKVATAKPATSKVKVSENKKTQPERAMRESNA